MSDQPFVILDDAAGGVLTLFRTPHSVISAGSFDEVPSALSRMKNALAEGFHVAGYFSYEFGYCLERRLQGLVPERRNVPLLWFGVFSEPTELSGTEGRNWIEDGAGGRAYCGSLSFAEDQISYGSKFRRILEYIRGGDIYQANLTFQATFPFFGDHFALYRQIRNWGGAGHGAFLCDGARHILSFSPELFFVLKDGRVVGKPMKGTARRDPDPMEDRRLMVQLQTCEKNRAENLMIVDLLRNDIGRISRPGSVTVSDLFAIESYPTVHQMVSTVSGTVKSDRTAVDVVAALFPCGSVTGAPKIRAMEIIREVEDGARGLYCGSIGTISPRGDARFNVAIRTLTIADNRGTLGIGGALVADSTPDGEFSECRLKARFYDLARRPIGLIETLRYEPGSGFVRGDLHCNRLVRSAHAFGIPVDIASVRERLGDAVSSSNAPLRVRLVLNESGGISVTSSPFVQGGKTPWRYSISGYRLSSSDPLNRHKTTWRDRLDGERKAALDAGLDETVFLNERDEVADGSMTSVFLRKGDHLLTPPLGCGALDGCFRRELLEAGQCTEAILSASDLDQGDVLLGNSLRGLIPAIRG